MKIVSVHNKAEEACLVVSVLEGGGSRVEATVREEMVGMCLLVFGFILPVPSRTVDCRSCNRTFPVP